MFSKRDFPQFNAPVYSTSVLFIGPDPALTPESRPRQWPFLNIRIYVLRIPRLRGSALVTSVRYLDREEELFSPHLLLYIYS